MAIYNVNGIALSDAIYPSFSMFETFGVIGDSFASGEIYVGGSGVDYYPLSWGQILARKTGTTAVNYSAGGLTTQTWLTNNTYGLGKLNSEPANKLYIIALGINDTNRLGPSKLGTIADITSDSTDSFYSYYGRIVRAIKAHAPNAVIMLSTCARFGGNYDSFSNAIKAIGQYYGFPVFDLSTTTYFQSSYFSTNQVSNHPTAPNYSGMASAYKELVENELLTHPTAYATFVG